MGNKDEREITIIIYDNYFDVSEVKKHPDWLFVYEDNDSHLENEGIQGIHYQKNAVGIPTRKIPNHREYSYYTDREYLCNKKKIFDAIKLINEKLIKEYYVSLVIPINGFGTGYAQLDKRAPKTFSYLKSVFSEYIDSIKHESSWLLTW